MNAFQDNYFDFQFQGDLNLHYCGNRENSFDHKYTHTQNAYLLTFVVSGSAVLSAGSRKIPLKDGDFYVMFPSSGVSYVTEPKIPWSIRWITLTGTQMEKLLPLMGLSPECPKRKSSDPETAEQILKKLFSIALKEDLSGKLVAISLLYELLALFAKEAPPSSENAVVSEAVAYIARHYNEKSLSVELLARRAYLNHNYFSKLFTSHMGVSPYRWILKTRMEKAKKLLYFTRLSVSSVAETVGYSDALYFSRAFRKYVGCSPVQYRVGREKGSV